MDSPPANERHPVLFAAGAGGCIGAWVAALMTFTWWMVLVGIFVFLGSAGIAGCLDARERHRAS